VTVAVPAPVRAILAEGSFCHVTALTPLGPHVTPMVFAAAGDRVWVTTSRDSVKAKAWRADRRVAGLVRVGERAACFTGTVVTYDVLDPTSWARSLAGAPLLAIASVRFTRKNARFFAGYAVDAHHVPLAWTPPGRVFAEVRIERSAVVEDRTVVSAWGAWDDAVEGGPTFRVPRGGEPPLDRLPGDVAERIGGSGAGALGLATPGGPVVLPVRWLAHGPAVYAAVGADVLALAGAGPSVPVALQVDHASWWRAREMVGAMLRGEGRVALPERLTSGSSAAARLAAEMDVPVEGTALVRIVPEQLVWWHGWSSGSVDLR
jgi:hypothetical protein